MPVCETSDFPPRSFPVFNGATALLVWQEVRNGHFLLALHWLQINVLLMFLPLLEFLLYFLWLCCSLYIHLLEKGYFFWKTYYSGFLVANFAFSVLFFLSHRLPYYQNWFLFFASLSFHHFPKATLGPQTTFPYLFESFSIKEQTFAFLSPLLFCTI